MTWTQIIFAAAADLVLVGGLGFALGHAYAVGRTRRVVRDEWAALLRGWRAELRQWSAEMDRRGVARAAEMFTRLCRCRAAAKAPARREGGPDAR